MAINMHTAGKKADWEYIKPEKWNKWQKIAAQTKGIITPANIISAVGALLVIYGFLQFRDGITVTGVLFIVMGRLADITDGYIAHISRTKSPLGEIVDTTVDKITVFFGLAVIIFFSLLPPIFTAAIIVQSLLNSTASLIGRQRGISIHPSQFGKLATFLAWFTIISYFIHIILKENGTMRLLDIVVFALSYISFVFFVLLSVHSTASYLSQLRSSRYRKQSK